MDQLPDFELEVYFSRCVAFPRYLGNEGPAEFCRRTVEEGGVMLLPHTVSESSLADVPTDRFRIGLGRTTVPASLDASRRHLERTFETS